MVDTVISWWLRQQPESTVRVVKFYRLTRLKDDKRTPVFVLEVAYDFPQRLTVLLNEAPVAAKGIVHLLTTTNKLVFLDADTKAVILEQQLSPTSAPVGAGNEIPLSAEYTATGTSYQVKKRPRMDQLSEAVYRDFPEGLRNYQEQQKDFYQTAYQDISPSHLNQNRVAQFAMLISLPYPGVNGGVGFQVQLAMRERGKGSDPTKWYPPSDKAKSYAYSVRDRVVKIIQTKVV